VLAYWNNGPQINMLLQTETLSWFRLFFPINAVCLAEKQQTPFFFGLNGLGTERTIYHTRLEHANRYTTDKVGIEHAYTIKWYRLKK
jgi:hypothetical protein